MVTSPPTLPALPPRTRLALSLRALSHLVWNLRLVWVACGIVLAGFPLVSNRGALDPAGSTVVVARTDIPLGTIMTPGHVVEHQINWNNRPPNPEARGGLATSEQVTGATLAVPLVAGSPIRVSDLVPRELFLGIPQGQVLTVVTIENAGILNYLTPGMRIDLLSSQGLDSGPQAPGLLAQGALVVSLGSPTHGDFSTVTTSETPWQSNSTARDFSSTVLVATPPTQSQALALGSHGQGVHAIIVSE